MQAADIHYRPFSCRIDNISRFANNYCIFSIFVYSSSRMKATAGNLAERGMVEALSRRRLASVPTLAGELNIPTSTAGNVLTRLVNKGLVGRRESETSGPGRPSYLYSIRLPRPILTLLFDGTHVAAAIVADDLSVLAEHSMQVSGIASASQAAAMSKEAFYTLLGKTTARVSDIKRAAVVINAIQSSDGTLSSSVMPWAKKDLIGLLDRELGLKTRIIASTHALAEYQLMPEPAPQSLACLNVGDGISGHTMIAGQIARGATGRAGELGHITIEPNGPRCGCGRQGCLEALHSGPAIAARVKQLSKSLTAARWMKTVADLSPRSVIEQLYQAWCAGDRSARSIMEDALDRFGWALGLIYNLQDPDLVICSGYVLQNRDEWIKELAARCRRWVLQADRRDLRIVSGRTTMRDHLRVIASQYHAQTPTSTGNT
jgi:predicted NBD/HSP70 family sugar kinase